MDDNSIIDLCLSGDKDAFGLIVSKYQKKLIAMSYGILGNKEEARDMTQEALIQAYLNLHQFNPIKNFRTWLFSIAYKRCIDLARKRKKNKDAMKRITCLYNPYAWDQPDDVALDISKKYQRLISTLSLRERAAFVLNVISDYSVAEISEIMKCSKNTVRVHQFNAKNKIKNALRKSDDM